MYLLVVSLLVLLVFMLDRALRTRLAANWKFWFMQLFTAVMVVLFDFYAVGRIWFFNAEATVGIYVFSTPLENLLFGFAMVGLTLVFFEISLQAPNGRKPQ